MNLLINCCIIASQQRKRLTMKLFPNCERIDPEVTKLHLQAIQNAMRKYGIQPELVTSIDFCFERELELLPCLMDDGLYGDSIDINGIDFTLQLVVRDFKFNSQLTKVERRTRIEKKLFRVK